MTTRYYLMPANEVKSLVPKLNNPSVIPFDETTSTELMDRYVHYITNQEIPEGSHVYFVWPDILKPHLDRFIPGIELRVRVYQRFIERGKDAYKFTRLIEQTLFEHHLNMLCEIHKLNPVHFYREGSILKDMNEKDLSIYKNNSLNYLTEHTRQYE